MEAWDKVIIDNPNYYVLIPMQKPKVDLGKEFVRLLSIIYLIVELGVVSYLIYETYKYIQTVETEPTELLIISAVFYLFFLLKLSFHCLLIEHIRKDISEELCKAMKLGLKICLNQEIIVLFVFSMINYKC